MVTVVVVVVEVSALVNKTFFFVGLGFSGG